MTAHNFLRYYLTLAGRHDEALSELWQTRELDPVSPSHYALLAWHHLSTRRFQRLIDELDDEAERDQGIQVLLPFSPAPVNVNTYAA